MMPQSLEGIHSLESFYKRNDLDNMSRAAMRIDRITYRLTGQILGRTDWKSLAGAQILDLGCGSDIPSGDGFYPPHLPRLLAANSVDVYGIDITPVSHPEDEPYTHITADIFDLVMNDRLSQLPELQGKQFDAIHSSLFLSPSPTLFYQLAKLQTRDARGYQNLMNIFTTKLLDQLQGMLKEGGVILLESRHFQKRDGSLVELPSLGE